MLGPHPAGVFAHKVTRCLGESLSTTKSLLGGPAREVAPLVAELGLGCQPPRLPFRLPSPSLARPEGVL